MSKKTIIINKSYIQSRLILLIQIFPIIIPSGLSLVATTAYQLIYVYFQKLMFLAITLLFLITIFKHKKKNIKNLFLLLMPIYAFILTFLNNGNFSAWYSVFIMPVIVFMFVTTNRYNLIAVIDVFLLVLEFWIWVNLLCMILYPEGMYYNKETTYTLNWILGYKSSLQYYILPALCLKWMKAKYKDKMIGFYILLIGCIAETVMGQNSMLTVGIAIFSVILVFNLYKIKVFCPTNYYIAVIIANVVMLVSNELLAQNYFWKILLGYFGKTVTLSSRTAKIWPRTIEAIFEKLWLGHGVLSSENRSIISGGFAGATHAHNQVLELLFVGGIVLFIFFIIYNVRINFTLTENYDLWSGIALSVSLFVLYLMVTVEVFTTFNGISIWLIIALAVYSKDIDNQFKLQH